MPEKLSNYFEGVIGAKRLRATEVDPKTSNGHEFQGVQRLRAVLGPCGGDKVPFSARFLYLGETEEATLAADGRLTWYDARADDPKRSPECRLYVYDNEVYRAADVGDLLVVAKQHDGSLLVVIVKGGSTYESQVRWLFDVGDDLGGFAVTEAAQMGREIGFAERFLLEELGVGADRIGDAWTERLLNRFPDGFPNTRDFSAFARETLHDVSAADDPDAALYAWMDREELLFRTLERHIVARRLAADFADVDDFIQFSLSVHQRRKSRVGYALENHLEQILITRGIAYSRGKVTENRSRPDFVFPGIERYRDPDFPEAKLAMLGVKSTCRDRWRQVLSEARRITTKHLLTLEPAISQAQTTEMLDSNLQLVIPTPLHATYSAAQRLWLWSVSDFLELTSA